MDNFHYFGLFLDTNTKNKLMNILTDNNYGSKNRNY